MSRLPRVHSRLLAAAELLGHSVTRLPGLLGAGCATAAAWDAFGRPAGLGVLAAFLLLLDWRLP